ncbi:MAG: uracil-DNA glycosylase [Alphaproteobacteria bacterium]
MWVGRDLGYRGGRRTGLALTDEAHLTWHAELLNTPPLLRATRGPAVKERTATVVWEMLHAIGQPVFLWNIFPFHPFVPGEPMSNRGHTRSERAACGPFLVWLLEALRPRIVVSIGRDAYSALEDLGFSSVMVRHPSYGGQNEFIAGLYDLYGVCGAAEAELDVPALISN